MNQRELADALLDLGQACASMREYRKALQAFKESLSIWKGYEDENGLARTFHLVRFPLFTI